MKIYLGGYLFQSKKQTGSNIINIYRIVAPSNPFFSHMLTSAFVFRKNSEYVSANLLISFKQTSYLSKST